MSSSKKYPEGPAKSAEILRVALPQMTRQAAASHPVSYAVWYEHASGRNPKLSQALAAVTQGGAVLDEDTTWRLYRDHVADVDEEAASRVADGIRKLLTEVGESAKAAGAQTDRFGDSLARFSSSVEHGGSPDPTALQDVLGHTREMREAVGQLQGRLDASQQEIERLRSEVERARTEALVDALTGLSNRRAFEQAMERAMAVPQATNSLLVTDIDHFKRVNDTYGHLFGDTVLRVVAQALKACVAAPQVAARVGGEEFAILLPGVSAAAALPLAEKIRATIAGARIRRKDSTESIGQVTVSLGVAARLPGESSEAWFERADRALYASKTGGRNRVTLAEH
jgi:diguanylate cyclase